MTQMRLIEMLHHSAVAVLMCVTPFDLASETCRALMLGYEKAAGHQQGISKQKKLSL